MKICLIGSSRFMDQYHKVNAALTLAGHIVYTIAMVSTSERTSQNGPAIAIEDKETLDLVHLRKIQESQAVVLITDESGYYGESTRREIKWAQLLGIGIFLPDDFLGLYRRPLVEDISEFIRARSSKDPDAMSRYYEATGHSKASMGQVIGGLAQQRNQ